jgi:hypothetical protein
MKNQVNLFVTILCLALLSPIAAFCLKPQHISSPICSHCPKGGPRNHPFPACCSTHQQLSPIVIPSVFEQFLQHGFAITPSPFNTLPAFHSLVRFPSKAPPHRVFPIVLRI